ncbi:MAG: hypothetical protein JWM82_2987 [Myxococcales bacterium]|nr:hypothetical protein [Myxococcales bacterium]
MKTLRMAIVASALTFGVGSQASAEITTAIQMNGVECFTKYSPDEANVVRDQRGITAGASGALLTCPISQASDDTNDTTVPELRAGTMFFSGTTPDWCYLAAVQRGTGSTFYSDNFTFSSLGQSMVQGSAFDANSDAGIVLVCSLEPGSTLQGFTAYERISAIVTGT